MKTKKCIKCGVRLHASDWDILKEMSLMPICDNCLFKKNITEISDGNAIIKLIINKPK